MINYQSQFNHLTQFDHLTNESIKIKLYMQNEPNFQKSQVNVNLYIATDYENKSNWTLGENEPNQSQNEPNSNPIQTQSNPISIPETPLIVYNALKSIRSFLR